MFSGPVDRTPCTSALSYCLPLWLELLPERKSSYTLPFVNPLCRQRIIRTLWKTSRHRWTMARKSLALSLTPICSNARLSTYTSQVLSIVSSCHKAMPSPFKFIPSLSASSLHRFPFCLNLSLQAQYLRARLSIKALLTYTLLEQHSSLSKSIRT